MALLGAALVLVLGLSSQGSFALWNDTSAVTTGSIASGSMDLQLATGDTDPGAAGPGTAYSAASITVSALTPSEAYAFPVTVKNVGDADFTVSVTAAHGSTWGFVGDPLKVQLVVGTPDTSDTAYPVQQSCGAAVQTTVVAAAPTQILAGPRVAHGTSTQLCLLVQMATDASSANQGQSATLSLGFTATQVTS